jgi:uncharacterized membrane protein
MTTHIGRLLEFLVEKRRTLKWIMFGVMAALIGVDVLVPAYYVRFPWDEIGGFGSLYGFVACVLIIVVSKALGYALLYRPEDYYDD